MRPFVLKNELSYGDKIRNKAKVGMIEWAWSCGAKPLPATMEHSSVLVKL